jgi:predicted DNA-binding WGR domain protein
MEKKKLLICTTKQHNKFWQYEVKGNTVNVKWGRVGGAEDSDSKTFPSEALMESFISKKMREKQKKGYVETNENQLKEQVQVARALGTQYKIRRLEFVKQVGTKGKVNAKGGVLSRMLEYDPDEWIYAEILNSWSKDVTYILLNKDAAYQIEAGGYAENKQKRTIEYDQLSTPDSNFVKGLRAQLKLLSAKVAKVAKKVVGLGKRLIMGAVAQQDGEEPETQEDPTVAELAEESGSSSQVVNKLVGLGSRILSL